MKRSQVARIVGKGGSNIHRVQDACGKVFIRSPPRDAEPHEDGTVSFQIRGRPNLCFQAYEMIQADLPEPVTFSAAEVNLGRPGDVAALIGPGGASIRSIMEATKVKVVTRPKEERSDLVVIEGLPDDVKRAYAMVIETIEKNKRVKEETPYRSSRNVAKEVPAKQNGEGGDQRVGEQQRDQRGPRGGKVGAGRTVEGDDRKWGAPKAPKFAGAPAKEPRAERGEGAAAAAGGNGGSAAAGGDADNKVKIEIAFPADKAGLLFGKEGNTVKHMKRKSKANVFVDSKALVVRVSGTQEQVDAARAMVVAIIERKPREKEEKDETAASAEAAAAAPVAAAAATEAPASK